MPLDAQRVGGHRRTIGGMTATNPEHPTTDPNAVSVDFQAITEGYQMALAEETGRRIMAEAMVTALKAERAELRQTVQALSPGAPTEPDQETRP